MGFDPVGSDPQPLEVAAYDTSVTAPRISEGAAVDPREPLDQPLVQSTAQGIPPDARRMGFGRNTEQGALLALTGSLDPDKRGHKVVAWLLLVAVAGPALFVLTSVLVSRA